MGAGGEDEEKLGYFDYYYVHYPRLIDSNQGYILRCFFSVDPTKVMLAVVLSIFQQARL